MLVWGLEFQGGQSEIGELDIHDAGSRGSSARGGAGGAAARCCHLLDAPTRVQAPPRPVLGYDGEVEGPSCLGAFTGVLELMSPFLGFGL